MASVQTLGAVETSLFLNVCDGSDKRKSSLLIFRGISGTKGGGGDELQPRGEEDLLGIHPQPGGTNETHPKPAGAVDGNRSTSRAARHSQRSSPEASPDASA